MPLPDSREFYRITYVSGRVYEPVSFRDLTELRDSGALQIATRIEHVVVSTTVIDVTGVFLQEEPSDA